MYARTISARTCLQQTTERIVHKTLASESIKDLVYFGIFIIMSYNISRIRGLHRLGKKKNRNVSQLIEVIAFTFSALVMRSLLCTHGRFLAIDVQWASGQCSGLVDRVCVSVDKLTGLCPL